MYKFNYQNDQNQIKTIKVQVLKGLGARKLAKCTSQSVILEIKTNMFAIYFILFVATIKLT